ncbi:F-box domain-containing protein [Meloidogyne graminicola]|uniref:F-box domain-containing protein n=1 Tax=Meloidogyne graminicola TaxID=189291 RepID=A0A8S9Z8X0_9BILA|nr:F-box domain-containing protein [Meloidogyne graminicola]
MEMEFSRSLFFLIRFNSFLSTCVYEPMPILPLIMQCSPSPTSGLLFSEMIPHFYLIISKWLDDASLRSLSFTCRRLHKLLPKLIYNRSSIEIIWKKQTLNKNCFDRRKYVENGFHEYFSSVQSIPQLKIQPQGPLIDHLQHCNYSNVYDLGIKPIELKNAIICIF